MHAQAHTAIYLFLLMLLIVLIQRSFNQCNIFGIYRLDYEELQSFRDSGKRPVDGALSIVSILFYDSKQLI